MLEEARVVSRAAIFDRSHGLTRHRPSFTFEEDDKQDVSSTAATEGGHRRCQTLHTTPLLHGRGSVHFRLFTIIHTVVTKLKKIHVLWVKTRAPWRLEAESLALGGDGANGYTTDG